MKATVYKCDWCKREKLETNHWFCLLEMPTGTIVIGRFEETRDEPKKEDICSQKCLTERINKWANQPTEVPA